MTDSTTASPDETKYADVELELTDAEIAVLEARAEHEGCTVSELVNKMLSTYMDEERNRAFALLLGYDHQLCERFKNVCRVGKVVPLDNFKLAITQFVEEEERRLEAAGEAADNEKPAD